MTRVENLIIFTLRDSAYNTLNFRVALYFVVCLSVVRLSVWHRQHPVKSPLFDEFYKGPILYEGIWALF